MTVRGVRATTSWPFTILYASFIAPLSTMASNLAQNASFPTRGLPKLYILSDFGRGGGGGGPDTAFAFLPTARNVDAMPFHQASDGASCGSPLPASMSFWAEAHCRKKGEIIYLMPFLNPFLPHYAFTMHFDLNHTYLPNQWSN